MRIMITKLNPDVIEPFYQTKGSAGFDIHSIEDIELKPGEISKIKTGMIIHIPNTLELQIRARSSLSLKGIVPAAGVATIDSDYTDELFIVLRNLNKTKYQINKGDRIAQGVFAPLYRPTEFGILGVAGITNTYTAVKDKERGGGFGSTGV